MWPTEIIQKLLFPKAVAQRYFTISQNSQEKPVPEPTETDTFFYRTPQSDCFYFLFLREGMKHD